MDMGISWPSPANGIVRIVLNKQHTAWLTYSIKASYRLLSHSCILYARTGYDGVKLFQAGHIDILLLKVTTSYPICSSASCNSVSGTWNITDTFPPGCKIKFQHGDLVGKMIIDIRYIS